MRYWFRGKRGGLLVFVLIAALVAGGLAWVTAAALRLEQEQAQARAEAELYGQLRLALWRLDSRVFPILAREASRPYNHYRTLFTPPVALVKKGTTWSNDTVFQPSPLIDEELPDWVRLHFQAGPEVGWRSPQVPSGPDPNIPKDALAQCRYDERVGERQRLLAELRDQLDPRTLVDLVQQQEQQMALSLSTYSMEENRVISPATETAESKEQRNQQSVTMNKEPNYNRGGKFDSEFSQRAGQRQQIEIQSKNAQQPQQSVVQEQPHPAEAKAEKVMVRVGPLAPLWLPLKDKPEVLVLARLVYVGEKPLCQGIVLDWSGLERVLLAEVVDLFPDARIVAVRESVPPHPERTMTALPLELDPGPTALTVESNGWTPLRVGLTLAWAAALGALLTVGLGGWSLLDLSERRIRFVSAVTHELRTPLTTLRLYLDMLTSGMVREEQHKTEYLHTLHAEADRLHRLIGNVLDFSRLENQRTRPEKMGVVVADLVDQVQTTWSDRCRDAGKELVIENHAAPETTFVTDPALVQQVLGNLIDNACKYSRHAEDPRIWLRIHTDSASGGRKPPGSSVNSHHLHFEVEDRGPGVPCHERRSIFRPFCRGRGVDTTASGVGLGLALALRWTHLLGGRLSLCGGKTEPGACFRVELPVE